MRRMSRVAFFFVAGISTLMVATGRSQSINPLLAQPASDWIDQRGPESTGQDWTDREWFSDLFDLLFTPPADVNAHPLVNPGLGPFLSTYHRVRYLAGVAALSAGSAPAGGVRCFHFYSSGWVVQASSFSFAVDFSDGPFDPIPDVAPDLVPLTDADIGLLADEIDAYFMTHIHADHISHKLTEAMIARGKPVFVTQQMADYATAFGLATAPFLTVPPTDTSFFVGPLEVCVFDGAQNWVYLDAAGTIPDPTSPLNAQNNAYLFRIDGVTLCHFGDNNDPDIVTWAATQAVLGWDVQVALQLGQIPQALSQVWSFDLKMHSHDMEFAHIGGAFLQYGMGSAPNPNRRVLLWGEHLDFVP